MLTERGVPVDHTTVYRWVQRYAPELDKQTRWYRRVGEWTAQSWRVDETYLRIGGKWCYLYRAVTSHGDTLDFYLSTRRNTASAKRFLAKTLRSTAHAGPPRVINTDKNPALAAAIAELKADGWCATSVRHQAVKYLNNRIEGDHGRLKRILGPKCGFKTLVTAYRTLKGIEAMHALRKGQGRIFAYGHSNPDVVIVEKHSPTPENSRQLTVAVEQPAAGSTAPSPHLCNSTGGRVRTPGRNRLRPRVFTSAFDHGLLGCRNEERCP
jgi:transposase, IS6 family